MAHLESKIINKGVWMKVSIIEVSFGFSQMLEKGKWVNTTADPKRFETEILTFGQCFGTETECEKFMKTKAFKSVFASIQKNWKI